MPCKALNKKGKKCMINTKNDLCHIHSAYSLAKKQQYSTDLIKENETLKATIDLLLNEKSTTSKKKDISRNIIKPIIAHPAEVLLDYERKVTAELREELNVSMKLIEEYKKQIKYMKPDYDRFQLIREFERKRMIYDKDQIDFYERPQDYHRLRVMRNQLVHEII